MNSSRLHDRTLRIWQAGVEAVRPSRLMRDKVSLIGSRLTVEDFQFDLSKTRRLIVIGAGKASAAMAIAFEKQIISRLEQQFPKLEISGWINCPESSFPPDEAGSKIQLFEARPAGLNVPTQKAIQGTEQILKMLESCSKDDLVVCLLSGGGSALLTAPVQGACLADKQAVARHIAAAGGNIEQLNTVRQALSRVKAGGLAASCKAGQMLTLVISDVLGNSLQTIASGPTCSDYPASPSDALQTLKKLGIDNLPELAGAVRVLKSRLRVVASAVERPVCNVQHIILGSNADAVHHAQIEAEGMGYECTTESATSSEGDVLDVAEDISRKIQNMLVSANKSPACYISGGEPTVNLPPNPGRGGRNQQMALAVLKQLADSGWPSKSTRELTFLSGGTDGEDGPTDAAGAWFDRHTPQQAMGLGLDPDDFLKRADPYRFFEAFGGLMQIGPTGTNVCDLRVATIE